MLHGHQYAWCAARAWAARLNGLTQMHPYQKLGSSRVHVLWAVNARLPVSGAGLQLKA